MTPRNLKTGGWRLSELDPPEEGAPTVFSCFHCGGGSSMGYKLAGFRVLGGVEIDPQMMELYRANHSPEFSFLEGVQEFNKRAEVPLALAEIDILDGSPPCSSFSMAGSREDAWGDEKKFREGQAVQVLDDLFFHFIETARRLRPKIVVAENVKGLILGNAKGYVKEIFAKFRESGYEAQLFLLNASRMGVPQARERTVFVARRKDLELPPLRLAFGETPITVSQILRGADTGDGRKLTGKVLDEWHKTKIGGSSEKYFQLVRPNLARPSPTITASAGGGGASVTHPLEPRKFSTGEARRLQTFPEDYNFLNVDPLYVMGMSVPPFMMQRIADQILRQWLA